MTSLPGGFESDVAQIIVAVGVFAFLLLWGGARFVRAFAELVRARGLSSLPPTDQPTGLSAPEVACEVKEVEVHESQELTTQRVETQRPSEPPPKQDFLAEGK